MSFPPSWSVFLVPTTLCSEILTSWETLSRQRSKSTKSPWTPALQETTSTVFSSGWSRLGITPCFVFQSSAFWRVETCSPVHFTLIFWASNHVEYLYQLCPLRRRIFPQASSSMRIWSPLCWICFWQELKPPAPPSNMHLEFWSNTQMYKVDHKFYRSCDLGIDCPPN